MLDIGWPEFTLVLIVALLVIGPKDLPKAMNGVGKWVHRARTVTREFQRHVDDMVKDSELEELRELRKVATMDKRAIAREIGKQIDPKGELKAVAKSLDTRDIGRPGEGGQDRAALEKAALPSDEAAMDEAAAREVAAEKLPTAAPPTKLPPAKLQPTKLSTEMTEEERAEWRETYRQARVTAAANARSTPRTTPGPASAERPAEDATPAAVDAGTEQAS